MEAHQKRVIAEQYELGQKIIALTTWIFGDRETFQDLDQEEQDYLVQQLNVMAEYFNVLGLRIDFWKRQERADLLNAN